MSGSAPRWTWAIEEQREQGNHEASQPIHGKAKHQVIISATSGIPQMKSLSGLSTFSSGHPTPAVRQSVIEGMGEEGGGFPTSNPPPVSLAVKLQVKAANVESSQVTQGRRGGTSWGEQAGSEQVKREPALWKRRWRGDGERGEAIK